MTKPLVLAVVGHTNVGKTSLLRTLMRDRHFGDISHSPSTTRHVEGAQLLVEGEALLALYDTPGLEDAIGLLDYCDQLSQSKRLDGPDKIKLFLSSHEAKLRFEQEAKVVKQLLQSDAGLYVIDAREPVLSKYKDELEILIDCGKPLLPVLNFVASSEHRTEDWRTALARLGLHALIQFDSVAPPEQGERRLYESLALLLEQSRPQLTQLIHYQEQQTIKRYQESLYCIAELLVDVAAYSELVDTETEKLEQAKRMLQEQVKKREQRCVESLLAIYRFDKNDAFADELPLINGRLADDLFNPETLKLLSTRLSKGALAGAATGAGVDLMLAGISLGVATLVGAVAGGVWQTISNYKNQLLGVLQGEQFLTVDDTILQILSIRQHALLEAIIKRGHAANQPIKVIVKEAQLWKNIPRALEKARAHPEWCSFLKGASLGSSGRLMGIAQLVEEFKKE